MIDFSVSPGQPEIGERVQVIPNHVCPVVNLFDSVHFMDAGGAINVVSVAARGRVG